MDPHVMRRIDFWVGVPLCFLLTIVSRVRQVVGSSPAVDAPRQVLFIQLAEMGTMVVAYPALTEMRRRHPDATIHFLSFSEIRASVEMIGAVDPANILTIDAGSLRSLVRDTLRFLRVARQRQIDTVVNLEVFVRFSTILSYLSGARSRVGFHRFNQEGLYTGDLLTHRVAYNAHLHAAHTFLDLVHAVGAPAQQVPRVKRSPASDALDVPTITTDAETRARLWRKLTTVNPEIDASHRLVVMNPNASKRFPMRKLPLDAYADLAEQLLEDPDIHLLVTGVADEAADADYICRRVGSDRATDLTGRTTLEELLHLLNLADVLITNDSGPAHFACLTGVHIVVFFGPELPERYRPLSPRCDVVSARFSCSPCVSPHNQRLTPCNDNQCLKAIRTSDVHALVRRRLEERSWAHAAVTNS